MSFEFMETLKGFSNRVNHNVLLLRNDFMSRNKLIGQFENPPRRMKVHKYPFGNFDFFH